MREEAPRWVLDDKCSATFAAVADVFAHTGGWKDQSESLLTPKPYVIGALENGNSIGIRVYEA